MNGLWTTLSPLIIGSAVVPMQIIVTILLLRTSRLTAVAWVSGMALLRLARGVVFGLILSSSDAASTDATADDGAGLVVSTVLLLVAILLLASGARQLAHEDDPDAPPPKWMAMIDRMTPLHGLAAGAGIMLIGTKFWVFDLGAIGAIGDTSPGQASAITTYVVYVVLAGSINLGLIVVTLVLPDRSDAVLDGTSDWLTRHNRVIIVTLSLVFGVWFLAKALSGFGIV